MEEQPVETTLYSLSDHTPDPVERRDGDRYLTLFRVGTIMVEDRRELCLIKNISAGGMMIRPYCKLESGTPVSGFCVVIAQRPTSPRRRTSASPMRT